MNNNLTIYNYKYPKPVNFKKDDKGFEIFVKVVNDENYFDAIITNLKNVRIANNSVIFKYFYIYYDSVIDQENDENYKKYKTGYKFYLKYIFPQLNFSNKRFITITDEYTSNYYHWHNFSLKKLVILKENNLIKNSILLLPKRYQKYSFVKPCLEKFGIHEKNIVYLRRKSHIKVASTPLIKVSRQHPRLFMETRKTLLKNVKKFNFDFGDKIYISRQKQKFRFVENNQEILKILKKYGFIEVIAEDFSYEEQIYIFSKAKYLIGPHGAGLTNLIFLQDSGSVMELASAGPNGTYNRDFLALASMLNIKYFYQRCVVGNNSNVQRDFHHGSLVVDAKKLEENIKLMLKQ